MREKSKKPEPCATAGCPNTLGPNARSEFCPNCRSSWGYWNKKRPAQVVLRRGKLRLFSSRMDEHMAKRGIEDKE